MYKALALFLAINQLLAAVFAIYRPLAPLQGSYTWEIVLDENDDPDSYTGGRTSYDYVSGYVRMDSYNDDDPTPGINGVTIWDLREVQPTVYTIDSLADCWVQQLSSNITAPMPFDWSYYTLDNVTYFNRALAEEWGDGYGGVVYVDVFSRNVVGMGNTSLDDDGQTIFWNIEKWTDDRPDGTEFLLPNTIPCKAIDSLPQYKKEDALIHKGVHTDFHLPHINFKCTGCQLAIGVVITRLCGGLGAAACAAFPPAIPFCAVLAGLACKKGASLGKKKACQIIHLC
jgi:hypothetical protein